MLRAIVPYCGLLAACASPPAPVPPPVPSGAPPVVAAADPPAPPQLPVAPPGADPEHVRLLGSICAVAARRAEDGHPVIGCTSHPPFSRPEQQPNGTLPWFDGDRLRQCEIAALYRGSFSRPGATEVVIAFDACWDDGESFSSNYVESESAVLVEEVAGRWVVKAYEESRHASRCWTSRVAGGRDLLLCQSGLAAVSLGEIDYVYALDFAKPERRATTLARLYGNLLDCDDFGRREYRFPEGFVALSIGATTQRDLNADGTPDLIVEVERSRLPPGPASSAKARRACAAHPPPKVERLVPAAIKTTLSFVSHGARFDPTPETRAALDAWAAETPEIASQLTGAAPP